MVIIFLILIVFKESLLTYSQIPFYHSRSQQIPYIVVFYVLLHMRLSSNHIWLVFFRFVSSFFLFSTALFLLSLLLFCVHLLFFKFFFLQNVFCQFEDYLRDLQSPYLTVCCDDGTLPLLMLLSLISHSR
jgi:hypothetical protein